MLSLLLAVALRVATAADLALTADQEAELAARKVVVWQDPQDDGTFTIGVIDVDAPPARALDAVIDLEARVGEVSGLTSVQRYLDEPAKIAARWELSVVGRAVVFHTIYDVDRSKGVAAYTLDPAKTNDLRRVEGSYTVLARGTGSRIVYRCITESDTYVPGWLKSWLANNSLVSVLEGMRTRAEK